MRNEVFQTVVYLAIVTAAVLAVMGGLWIADLRREVVKAEKHVIEVAGMERKAAEEILLRQNDLYDALIGLVEALDETFENNSLAYIPDVDIGGMVVLHVSGE